MSFQGDGWEISFGTKEWAFWFEEVLYSHIIELKIGDLKGRVVSSLEEICSAVLGIIAIKLNDWENKNHMFNEFMLAFFKETKLRV